MAPSRGNRNGTYLSMSPYQVQVSYGRNGVPVTGPSGNLAPASSGNAASAWFSPLEPIHPLAPVEVAGRQWDFPAGYNLNTVARTYEPVSFPVLRALADAYDILRLVIETRKDQVARMKWQVMLRDAKKGNPADSRIKVITDFFSRPDGYHDWSDWIRLLLEDLFVIDAPTLYMSRDRGGRLISLMPIDGATIKPVIDDWGRRPLPFMQNGKLAYPVAYQQILKGYPAIDYSVRDLIYRPRNIRLNHAYGYGPVEQIINTVNTGLRRELFTLNYFEEGTVPDSIITLPDTWTPQQISDYQKFWDSYFSGDLARRRKVKFAPGNTGKNVFQMKEPDLKGEFDEWLARIICFAFSISPQAFVRQMNRASADTQKEIAEEEGLMPILGWIKSMIDRVLADEFEAADLEFAWGEDTATNEVEQETILSAYTSNAIMTLNEARDKIGLDPSDDPAANKLMVKTGTGYFPIDANTIEGKQANIDAFGPPPAAPQFGDHEQPSGDEDGNKEPPQNGRDTKKLLKDFNPDQPRDDDGKWTSGSSGDGGTADSKFYVNMAAKVAVGAGIVVGMSVLTAALPEAAIPVEVAAAAALVARSAFASAAIDGLTKIFEHTKVPEEVGEHIKEAVHAAIHAVDVGFGKAATTAIDAGDAGRMAKEFLPHLGDEIEASVKRYLDLNGKELSAAKRKAIDRAVATTMTVVTSAAMKAVDAMEVGKFARLPFRKGGDLQRRGLSQREGAAESCDCPVPHALGAHLLPAGRQRQKENRGYRL